MSTAKFVWPDGTIEIVSVIDIESTSASWVASGAPGVAYGTTRYGAGAWCVFRNGKAVQVFADRKDADWADWVMERDNAA